MQGPFIPYSAIYLAPYKIFIYVDAFVHESIILS